MAKLSYFDCNCSIGRIPYPYIYDISDVEGLKREMDTAGIEEALVYHSVARDVDPAMGNALLGEALAQEPRLHPCWAVLPHYAGDLPAPGKLLKDMEANGVKAVRMFPTPANHSFSLAEWNSGELLGALAEAKVPLLLDIEVVWWDAIVTILKNHPNLPVIATNVGYRHNRFTHALFGEYENLFLETSRYFGAGVFEDVVGRFGSRPILLGSNMPRFTGTAVISMLTYADIPQADKEAIAGGNLRRLLKEAYT
ncbi:MAG: amidohydrolase family protein [Candidatus Latescibacterota bacterium]